MQNINLIPVSFSKPVNTCQCESELKVRNYLPFVIAYIKFNEGYIPYFCGLLSPSVLTTLQHNRYIKDFNGCGYAWRTYISIANIDTKLYKYTLCNHTNFIQTAIFDSYGIECRTNIDVLNSYCNDETILYINEPTGFISDDYYLV